MSAVSMSAVAQTSYSVQAVASQPVASNDPQPIPATPIPVHTEVQAVDTAISDLATPLAGGVAIGVRFAKTDNPKADMQKIRILFALYGQRKELTKSNS